MLLTASVLTLQMQQQMAPQKLDLNTAVYAFRTNVDSPDLLRAFDTASRSTSRTTKLKGLFFKGRYYQRQYELATFGGLGVAGNNWQNACNCFNSYTTNNRGTASDYLSDAWFFKAMLYLEKGSREECLRNLKSITNTTATKYDKMIYIEHILWTPGSNYAIGAAFPTAELRDAFVASLSRHKDDSFKQSLAEAVASDLRYWCTNKLRAGAQKGPAQSPPRTGG